MRDRVVPIQNQNVAGLLVQIEVLLGRHVFLHILVDIQMVRRQIRDHGHVGAVGEVHQLEGGELQDDLILGADLIRLVQQRCADVAAEPDAEALLFEHLRDQRRGRGLAVGARDRDDRRGTDGEEGLHLGADDRALIPQRSDLRRIGMQARRAEYHVAGDPVQIVLPQVEPRALRFQLQDLGVQLFPRRFVAAGHVDPVAEQQPHQRSIADAHAQDQDPTALEHFKIYVQSRHIRSLPV